MFAVLGLLPTLLAEIIQPQYMLAVNEVYMQTFFSVTKFTRRLDLLGCTYGQPSVKHRPSWVPDLTTTPDRQFIPSEGSCSSGCSSSDAYFVEPGQLHVKGTHQGEVCAVSAVLEKSVGSTYPVFRKLVLEFFPDSTSDDIFDTYAWLITFGDLRERWWDYDYYPTLEEAREILNPACDTETPHIPDRYAPWYGELSIGQQQARYFVTDQGNVGIGPPAIQAGDRVCLLLGSRFPTTLRPMLLHSASEQYQVLGASYVHGLMEGQALLGPLPKHWTMIVESFYPIDFAFRNTETKEITVIDPRLVALPEEWERVEVEDETHSNYALRHYRHRHTAEVLDSDPRLLPDALRARGVKLETIILI